MDLIAVVGDHLDQAGRVTMRFLQDVGCVAQFVDQCGIRGGAPVFDDQHLLALGQVCHEGVGDGLLELTHERSDFR